MILIKKYFQYLKKSELISTSFYSGIGFFFSFMSGIVVNKIIALSLGPNGIALISQFQNFIGISSSLATGGIHQGVVKYVSEFRSDEEQKSKLLSTSLTIIIAFSLIVSGFILMFSKYFSKKLFDSNDYNSILIIFGCNVLLFGLNTFLISVLNGAGEIKKLILVNISSNLFGLFVTSTSAYFFGLFGALIALASTQTLIFFVSLTYTLNSKWFNFGLFKKGYSKVYGAKLFNFSLMSIFSMIIPPIVLIGIRNHIAVTLSFEEAGYWDGLWKISAAYLGIITTTLSIYFLPKLSSITDNYEIRNEILNGYKLITLPLLIAITTIYFFRREIVLILYSDEFIEMEKLFLFQLIGDFFKVFSWLLSYLMIAKAKIRLFIFSELSFSILFFSSAIFFIDKIGLYGVVISYSLSYFFYLGLMFFFYKKYFGI